MKKYIFTLLLFLLAGKTLAQTPLFPTPARFSWGQGSFTVGKDTPVGADTPYGHTLAAQLRQELPALAAEANSSGAIRLSWVSGSGIPKEGYRLSVTPGGITAEAGDSAGMFYAVQSIRQLLRFGGGKVEGCRIEDAPRYEWRGYMLDESRHFFGMEKVKQYLDLMAQLKMNVFHWHLTDSEGWRIEIKRYPKLTSVGAVGNWHEPEAPAQFYTQEQIREIVAYAAERHITVVPEIDMPGHATAVGKSYPKVSGGGEGRWEHFTYHPAKEETYRFIANVFDEITELFPSPYIHIGGDEVHYGNQSWFTDPVIRDFIREHDLKNEVGLEHYFIRRVADTLAVRGKTMIGWDEMIDAGVSPRRAVIMWWRHDRTHQLVKALENGYRVIMTPRRPMYADFVQYYDHKTGRNWNGYNPIEDVYRFPDQVSHLFKNFEDQILGLQFNLWTERVADVQRLDFMTFPRLIAVAEAGWTAGKAKESSLFLRKLPAFLRYLDTLGIYYFDPFDPAARPEPMAPEKEDVIQNG